MTDQERLLHDLLKRISYLEAFTADGRDFFFDDLKTQEAVIRIYEVIGEIAKRLPEPFLAQQPQIEWKRIKGFRDFLIHNYDQIDLEFVWQAIEKLPELKGAIQALLS